MGRPFKVYPPRFCQHCGETLTRKRFPNSYEDAANFLKRKYCNQKCMAEAMIKTDEVSRSAYHLRARKHLADSCAQCGSTEELDVHHKDRDIKNSDPSNLETLCHTCHMKWHHESATRPKKAKKLCSECDQPARSNGYCQKHYFRFRRHGDPNKTKQERGY